MSNKSNNIKRDLVKEASAQAKNMQVDEIHSNSLYF